MSGIKRWEWDRMSEGYEQYADGDYVLHSDYETAVGELTSAKSRWFFRAAEYLKRAHLAEAEVSRLRAEVDALR